MKSFIIAVTSISYILSIATIVNAKVKTSAKKNIKEQTCLNQSITTSKQSRSVISTEDIRGICQAISEEYKSINNSTSNLSIADSHFTPFKDFIEIEKIKLTSFEVEKRPDEERKYTYVDIVETARHFISKSMKKSPGKSLHNNKITIDSYNWEPNPDKEETTTRTRQTCVHKIQGKWSVTTYNCEINSKK